jgi:hypothetical protein
VEENGKAFSGESENAFFHGDVIFDDWVSSPLIKRIQWMGTGFGAIPFNFTLDAIKPEWKPRNLITIENSFNSKLDAIKPVCEHQQSQAILLYQK